MSNLLYNRTSKTCGKLLLLTKSNTIDWIGYDRFIKHLEALDISVGNIRCLDKYFKHLQSKRFVPVLSETYFCVYEKNVFAISQSKYSRDIRMDMISAFYDEQPWQTILGSQIELIRLHNIIQLIGTDESVDQCNKLLYTIGSIHV